MSTNLYSCMQILLRPFVVALKDILKAHREPTRYNIWSL